MLRLLPECPSLEETGEGWNRIGEISAPAPYGPTLGLMATGTITPPELKTEARRLYAAGPAAREIESLIGVSCDTVQRRRKGHRPQASAAAGARRPQCDLDAAYPSYRDEGELVCCGRCCSTHATRPEPLLGGWGLPDVTVATAWSNV